MVKDKAIKENILKKYISENIYTGEINSKEYKDLLEQNGYIPLDVKSQGDDGYNPKQVGEVSEIKCIAKFVELNIPVSKPFGDNQRYDFIIENSKGKLLKIQCKTARMKENGAFVFSTRSTNWNKKKHRNYIGEIDGFCAYLRELDKIYLYKIDNNKTIITMRLIEALNNNIYNIRMAEDYELKSIKDVDRIFT